MRQTRSTPLTGMEAELFHKLVLTMGMEFRGSELNESVQEPWSRQKVAIANLKRRQRMRDLQ